MESLTLKISSRPIALSFQLECFLFSTPRYKATVTCPLIASITNPVFTKLSMAKLVWKNRRKCQKQVFRATVWGFRLGTAEGGYRALLSWFVRSDLSV
jgi:hypothetical protein